MVRSLLRRKKLASGLVASMLAATAFQAGGCTVNIDQNLLAMLQGVVGSYLNNSGGGFQRPPFMHPPECGPSCSGGTMDGSGDDPAEPEDNLGS